MSEISETIMARAKQVLLGDRDPIGVQNLPEKYRRAATDEYDASTGPIVGMLLADRSEQEIANFLYDTEVRSIGRRRSRGAADLAAAKLVDLRVGVMTGTQAAGGEASC